MKPELSKKLLTAFEKDHEIFCAKNKAEDTLGSNPDYLLDAFGITKSDLIRLERLGFAVKARYATSNKRSYFKTADGKPIPLTGPHRTRWILFTEVFNGEV